MGGGRVGYENQGTSYDPHASGHEAVGRDSAPTATDVSPCPFCGSDFEMRGEHGGSRLAVHPGVPVDRKCVLSGYMFREHQFEMLNKRPAK
jgi:hypothetical protein